jgi:sarcosine oxidase subunit beta
MIETEILIIGGGIAGASTAYHLALYGRHVTLVERNDIASEASGVNAGAIGAIGWGNVPNLESYLTMGSLEIFKSL